MRWNPCFDFQDWCHFCNKFNRASSKSQKDQEVEKFEAGPFEVKRWWASRAFFRRRCRCYWVGEASLHWLRRQEKWEGLFMVVPRPRHSRWRRLLFWIRSSEKQLHCTLQIRYLRCAVVVLGKNPPSENLKWFIRKKHELLLYKFSLTGDTVPWPPKDDQTAVANEALGTPDGTTLNTPSLSTAAGGTVYCTIDLFRKKIIFHFKVLVKSCFSFNSLKYRNSV